MSFFYQRFIYFVIFVLFFYTFNAKSQIQHVNNGSFEASSATITSNNIDDNIGDCNYLIWPPVPNNCDGWYNIFKVEMGFFYHTQSTDIQYQIPTFGTIENKQFTYDGESFISIYYA